MAEKGEAVDSVTLGHIRSHGCRDHDLHMLSIGPCRVGINQPLG
jgi:hypothetical protein